jgi:hydroxyisourate hydrolase
MSGITTHILDTSAGKPAAGVNAVLEMKDHNGWLLFGRGITDADGRIKNLVQPEKKITAGVYRLTFDTKSYFLSMNLKTFYSVVVIEFEVTDDSHYHVPLLLAPFGYSTYRGS